MGGRGSLSQTAVRVVPGGTASVEVRVRNTGSIVDQFALEVLGDARDWASVDPPVLSLFPDSEESVRIVFGPPRDPSVRARTMPFGVLIRSREDPNGSASEEGTIEVEPFLDPSAELIPRTSRGSRSGRHDLAVDNRGNVTLRATFEARDPDRLVELEFSPASVSVEPGAAAFARARVKPSRTFWRGAPQTRSFQVAVHPNDGQPLLLPGTFHQEPILPPWLGRAVTAALAVFVAFALLWAGVLQPQIRSSAESALRSFGFTPAPGSSAAEPQGSVQPSPGIGSSPSPLAPPPSPVSTSVAPVPGASGPSPVAGRLDQHVNGVTANDGALYVTDLVFSNPTGASGDIELQRGSASPMERLLALKLDNFRDLDFHFVTPIAVGTGQTLQLVMHCAPATNGPSVTCDPSVLYSGYVQKP